MEEHLVGRGPNQKAMYKKAKNHKVLKTLPNCLRRGYLQEIETECFVRRRWIDRCMYTKPLISPKGYSGVMRKVTWGCEERHNTQQPSPSGNAHKYGYPQAGVCERRVEKQKKDRKKKENAGSKGEDATMEMWHQLS